MGVDDVDSGAPRASGAGSWRPAEQGARAQREREHVDLDVAAPPQRVDLVADEPAPLGCVADGHMFVTTSARTVPSVLS